MFSSAAGPSRSAIQYSCYVARSREGEQFVPEHIFGYQLAGSLTMTDGHGAHTFEEGDFRFCQRNQLVKFSKQPPAGGEFQALSVYLDQETLRRISLDYGYQAAPPPVGGAGGIRRLPATPLYRSFVASLRPYEHLQQPGNEHLLALKVREAVLLLLQANPELRDVLFDFAAPGKIDLEAFMSQNFRFNVALKRFAYLTGRSLATFKRDFEKIFRSSPSRWLQQRRLQEAHYLIKEKGQAPSEVYLAVGFEDLSHFSFAFKKTYGVAPSRL
ncbi:helix-turn-helix domain-containing protein [Hymenobacter sp. HMF4947]|uniref:Helix-turn-helix domain-containing protein n=1 Tax=Hymenobacter ginkgonis TaxID=2682976 RepID=A0A7K1T982_9BACT|nr:AraC family transcriptional regulator [Hymenobacter ginkgonis]MVN74967.1 helix-turn-helix domain-containing protein [Hymenobacter ginkgonis]